MLHREIIAVCSQIHTNTLCGQNVELLNVKLAVHIMHFTEPHMRPQPFLPPSSPVHYSLRIATYCQLSG